MECPWLLLFSSQTGEDEIAALLQQHDANIGETKLHRTETRVASTGALRVQTWHILKLPEGLPMPNLRSPRPFFLG